MQHACDFLLADLLMAGISSEATTPIMELQQWNELANNLITESEPKIAFNPKRGCGVRQSVN